jgi:hypothetical protein
VLYLIFAAVANSHEALNEVSLINGVTGTDNKW